MGTSQSYGQAISTFNEKKIALLGQINVKVDDNLITEIVVGFGNTIFPQLWNSAIIESRNSDTDFSLNIRRYVKYDQDFGQSLDIQGFQMNEVVPNKNFGEIQSKFFIHRLPLYVVEHQNENESQLQYFEKKYYAFTPDENNPYRKQYKELYKQTFLEIAKSNQIYTSVGILDMKTNNIALGIDNFQMTSDILDAFIECMPKIHKLIFISENLQQAQIMALALKEKADRFKFNKQEEISYNFQEQQSEGNQIIKQEKHNDSQEELQIEENKIEIIIQNQNDRIPKKPEKVSHGIGHMQDLVYQFFRDSEKPLNPEVCNTIVPIIADKLCLCGRKTKTANVSENCCYCGQVRPIFRKCEQRACGRNYCASCMYPSVIYKKCQGGHQLQFHKVQENEIQQQEKCVLCQSRRFKLGTFICTPCRFYLCGECYYVKYSEWQYQKFKMYWSQIQKMKPHYRHEVQNKLITEYLINFEQLGV